ncbi:Spc97-like protein [Euroglyphus maynei]|uniref:Spc97-like protein n=1 Tax=Euroglyphus maynei TaxID=6958 RepID=A0A1Y3BDJ4_EURMA|nr:Spc97-like protein [Euroglyphus maynei]
MFMINTKLIDMHKVYKIDSLLYNNFELNENLVFTFTKNVQMISHHLGWDCFIVRYTFSKNVYRVMFDAQLIRYERLFRQLFYYKRVLYSIRKAQHQIIFYRRDYRPKHPSGTRLESRNVVSIPADMLKVIVHMLNTLHFLFFHMFGFSSRMYRYFGQQIETLWSTMFEVKFGERQKNVEKFVYAHEKFLRSIESVIFFDENIELLTAYAALNDSIIDFCESFCEMEFFPAIVRMMMANNDGYNHNNQNLMNKSKPRQQQQLLQRQGLSEQLFKLQFKITVNISKYRCCIRKFIQLLQQPQSSASSSSSSTKCASNFEFKYDLLTYQPCLDGLFRLFSFVRRHSPPPETYDDDDDDDGDSSIEF